MKFFTVIPITNSQIRNELARTGANFPSAPTEGYHITLRYVSDLGNVSPLDVVYALKQVLKHHEPFTLTLGAAGTFTGGVHWMGVEESQELTSLQSDVDRTLQRIGLEPSDFDEYVPHITLGMSEESIRVVQPRKLTWTVDTIESSLAEESEYRPPISIVRLEESR